MDGLNVVRMLRAVPERLPNDPERFGQRGLADVGVLPDRIDELGLRHHPSRTLQQVEQDRERPRGHPDLFILAPERSVGQVGSERSEPQDAPG